MGKARPVRYALAGVGALLLVLVVWLGWTAWQVNKDLSRAVDSATALQDAVSAADEAQIDDATAAMQEAAASAHDRTSGPAWQMLTVLPWFGDDAEGVEVAASVLDDLSHDGVTPLADVADRLDEMLPRDGRVDLTLVAELSGPIGQAQQAFADADHRLGEQDSSGYVGRLRSQYDDFAEQVAAADRAMSAADATVSLLPSMLGGERERNYLIAFENNAEIRSAGGLVGAAAQVRADAGKVELVRHVSGGSIQYRVDSPVPITKAERQLYDNTLGDYFVNSSMTPDIPRAAELAAAHWETAFPQQQIDGVVFVDTVALSYLLDAAGPITVDGVQLTGENLVDELLHNTYLRLEGDGAAQDQFFADVAAATFERFTTDLSDGSGVVEALATSVGEGRVRLHSFDQTEQAEIAGTEIAGEVLSGDTSDEPKIAITIDDTTGSKMSYYLRYDVDVNATYCSSGGQGYSAKVRLKSVAPKDASDLPADVTGGGNYGTPPGDQTLTVRFFGPAGGSLGDFELNSQVADLVRVDADGRPAGKTYITLSPGEVIDLAWTMKSGEGQVGDAEMSVTPTIEPTDTVKTVRSAC
ncbi:DUF4012 domain-containing protein [Nocardioides sambongensis]|uniref:DUF4012 domain-containing protein n=1 Tax=Nocardioides sambongensis TaxID=2589074 RepID=UPI00112B2EDA|nr:DUF4012 domain-containing protein [Nocardioides sambongensis]